MLGLSLAETAVILAVTLVVVGPKELPAVIRGVARAMAHVRELAAEFRHGLDELAALVLAAGYWFVTFILLGGFAFAVMPIVAKALGAQDTTLVRRATRMAMWISVIVAMLVYPIFLFSEAALIAMGQEPHIAALAQPFNLEKGQLLAGDG
mgnify:CR=1 FL=1